jgi:hypothetical protein
VGFQKTLRFKHDPLIRIKSLIIVVPGGFTFGHNNGSPDYFDYSR